MRVDSHSEKETADFAARLAIQAAPGAVFLLSGPLGAGKSVFARAFIRALADNPALEVPSPTFTLVQTYDLPAGSVWHFDLYRLEKKEDVYEVGWEEALSSGGTVLVEWPERLGSFAPSGAWRVVFSGEGAMRRIEVKVSKEKEK